MSELDKIKADLAFYNEVLPLEEELEEARAVKKDDPERWLAAKQAFEEKRRFYRQIAQGLPTDDELGNVSITADTAGVVGTAKSAGDS